MGSGFPSVFLVDSYVSRRFTTFHLKNRRTFTLFTISIATRARQGTGTVGLPRNRSLVGIDA
jgi:hypothetical protein